MISCIVSVGKNYKLKETAHHGLFFSGFTQGKTLVAGHNTYHTLPKITNSVIKCETDPDWNLHEDIVIIGGEKTYKKYAPFVDELYITFNDIEAEKVDTYFPIDYYSHLTEKQVVFKGVYENMKFEIHHWKAKEKF